MPRETAAVTSVAELVEATKNGNVESIVVTQDLTDIPTLWLQPSQSIHSHREQRSTLSFVPGADGIRLSSNNTIERLDLRVSTDNRAIFNDYSVPDLGRTAIRLVTSNGRVQIIARDELRAGHVEVEGLDIISADARSEHDRPNDYGVSVLQGAFTLWNMQTSDASVLTANLIGLSAGRLGAPVLGSGVFVSGAGTRGGRLNVQRLETNAVYSDGKIAPGTSDQITGGVFTVYGTHVDVVVTRGPVVTYGVNDMALDNWGDVDRWISRDKITTLGPSGIGFVNFGHIGELRIEALIETFGQGARGFNVYTGTVDSGDFDRIVTHGDGAVGVQISQPVGELIFRRGIETFGATGQSLVKGVLQDLSAIALSIKPTGSARLIRITGGLRTHGKGVIPLEQQGTIDRLSVQGGFTSIPEAADLKRG